MATAKVEIIVVADAAQAEAVLGRLGTTVGTTGKVAETEAKKMESFTEKLVAAGPAGQTAATGVEEIAGALTSKLGVASGAASGQINALNKMLGGLSGSALGAAAGIAAAATAAIIVAEVINKAVEGFIHYADGVRRMEVATGLGAREAGLLVNEFKLLGIGADEAAGLMFKLEKGLGTGKLAKFGIEAKDASGNVKNFNVVLDEVLDRMASSTSASEKAAIASAAFGKGALALTPLLAMNREELEKLKETAANGFLPTDQDIIAAHNLEVSIRALGMQVDKIKLQFGEQLLPVVQGALTTISTAIDHVSFDKMLIGITKLMDVATAGVPVFETIARVLGLIGQNQSDAAKSAGEYAAATEDLSKAADQATEAISANIDAAQAQLDLERMQVDWAKKVADAEAKKAKDIADAKAAQKKANADLVQAEQDGAAAIAKANADVSAKIIAGHEAIAAARKHQSDSALSDSESVISASEAVTAATQRQADNATRDSDAIVSAQNRILDIQQRIRQDKEKDVQSARSVADAETNLGRIRDDIAAGRLVGENATRAVVDAEQRLQRAKEDSATASQNRNDRLESDERELAQAEKTLDEARHTRQQDKINDAVAVNDARRKLAEAEKKRHDDAIAETAAVKKAEVESANAIKLAREAVAAAEQAASKKITIAKNGVTTAAEKLRTAEHESGVTAMELRQHELDLEKAHLRVETSTKKAADAVSVFENNLGNAHVKAALLGSVLEKMNATTMPEFIRRLGEAGLTPSTFDSPTSSTNPDSDQSQNRAAHRYASQQSVNVQVNAGGLVMDKTSADSVGQQVADGVWKALLAKQANGTNLHLNGR
jgi:hypothetical protein